MPLPGSCPAMAIDAVARLLVPMRISAPVPAAHEVLIAVAAAGVNRADLLQVAGRYAPPEGASPIPGLEVAGTIIACGVQVAGWQVGDKVCALLAGGGYADLAVADAACCLPVPSGYSFAEAACLPEALATVWANLFADNTIPAGGTVLVHGGASGIGHVAIQLARLAGHPVIATASSAAKHDFCRELGAQATYDYRAETWHEQVQAEWGGVDFVLDMGGGALLARNLACLRPGGRHVSIAYQAGRMGEMPIDIVMRRRLHLTGSTLRARPAAEKAGLLRGAWGRFFTNGLPRLRIYVNETMMLGEAAAAHKKLESGAVLGKMALLTGAQ